MERTNSEKLQIYRLAEKLADEIWKVVVNWDYFEKSTPGSRIVRSADSIGANTAEGTGRGSFKDNRRLIRNARGSLNETRHWSRRAHSRNLLSVETTQRIKPIIDEPSPKLNAYLRSIGPITE